MAIRYGICTDLLILGMAVALLAPVIIPSHWTSIWMDRAFTGTVAPLANRLDPGVRLYADGVHTPMSPLPFLLMRLLTRGHATWLWESGLNFGFQALTLLLSYLALRRLVRPPVPFLATFVAIPVFFALTKTCLFDAMAQASVAALVLQAVAFLSRRRATEGNRAWVAWLGPRRSLSLPLFALALTSAVALLVKQSTGIGACLGLAAALVLCDQGSWKGRVLRTAAWGLLTASCLAVLIVALHPWVDGAGLIRDVLLTGSEPKGGPVQLLADLGRFALSIAKRALVLAVPIAAVVAALRAGRKTANVHRPVPPGHRGVTPGFVAVGATLAALAMLALVTVWPSAPLTVLAKSDAFDLIQWAGLFFAALLGLRRWQPGLLRGVVVGRRVSAFAGAFAITFAAAMFHGLSIRWFRWSHDNNPLVLVAYAALFQVTLAALDHLPARRQRPLAVALVCFVVIPLPAWARLGDQLLACRQCTERWAEVRHLVGAKMRPAASGMRRLVEEVRRSAAPGEQVLLLPNDPEVEAWFERDRPHLSSLIVFVDQYWDRYVDNDVATLKAQPPQVIVVGPVGFWRQFHHHYQHGRGAERLIDRITRELLPQSYELRATVPILHRGQTDSMEVYVRRR